MAANAQRRARLAELEQENARLRGELHTAQAELAEWAGADATTPAHPKARRGKPGPA